MPTVPIAKPLRPPPPTARSASPGKRRRILDAAVRVFAGRGYHGSRISDIANEAGIAYGLVYHYFDNKEQILDTIFEERWSIFLDAVQRIADGEQATRDKLLAIAHLVLDAYRLRPEWVKVLVFEIQRSARFAQPEQVRAVGRLFQILGGVVREGQQAGELREDVDSELACFLFVGGLEIVLTGRVLQVIRERDGERNARDVDAEVAQTVVELFLGGLEARAT